MDHGSAGGKEGSGGGGEGAGGGGGCGSGTGGAGGAGGAAGGSPPRGTHGCMGTHAPAWHTPWAPAEGSHGVPG